MRVFHSWLHIVSSIGQQNLSRANQHCNGCCCCCQRVLSYSFNSTHAILLTIFLRIDVYADEFTTQTHGGEHREFCTSIRNFSAWRGEKCLKLLYARKGESERDRRMECAQPGRLMLISKITKYRRNIVAQRRARDTHRSRVTTEHSVWRRGK